MGEIRKRGPVPGLRLLRRLRCSRKRKQETDVIQRSENRCAAWDFGS